MSNVIHLLTGQPIASLDEVMPDTGECLVCFVNRMVTRHGCTDGLGWVEQFRVHRARRATALLRRLGAERVECDCALTDVLWRLSPGLWDWGDDRRLVPPAQTPPCLGVRPNSTQPCEQWVSVGDLAV